MALRVSAHQISGIRPSPSFLTYCRFPRWSWPFSILNVGSNSWFCLLFFSVSSPISTHFSMYVFTLEARDYSYRLHLGTFSRSDTLPGLLLFLPSSTTGSIPATLETSFLCPRVTCWWWGSTTITRWASTPTSPTSSPPSRFQLVLWIQIHWIWIRNLDFGSHWVRIQGYDINFGKNV